MLPIGSVVYLQEGSQKLMIISRGVIVKEEGENVLFDYSASLYPLGVNPDKTYYFNQENIDKVIFEGYKDEDEERFQELYTKWLETDRNQYPKGKVPKNKD
ncbi:DUF4176 domain-containing protein [Streptococcus suis]|uniref:DUF4176 domain-containing protein n=1 Tax=Streptococcus suis TaxID=1307 RepID=UPI00042084B2|nr:DUF4176 domain-containing protein [Streptococcus suis]MBM7203791.1 DUF4176 domain-containing protein [Streptococcus suis]MBM7282914.1 DUF4176 domain-containing protein [Streptococcus suis]MBO4135342.1 DUF4176 domain-containing protein [Streptococcus suis]HEL9639726.1 DUF4176 domain-containing protein [Streptococcus suis]HEM5035835.1 DUF4176 domain-containing protein [Streptococcus suis]